MTVFEEARFTLENNFHCNPNLRIIGSLVICYKYVS